MRKPIRQLLLGAASFFIISYFYPGLLYENIQVLIFASAFFGIITTLVRPVLNFLSLPLNLFTFGLFGFLTGAIVIYLVSFLVKGISVSGFDFVGAEISGFILPSFYVIPILSALFASVLLSWLSTLLRWLFN